MKCVDLEDGPIQLVSLDAENAIELEKIAQDKRIWQHNVSLRDPENFKSHWLDKVFQQMEQGKRHAYVIYFSEQVVGSTSFYDINERHKHLSIGYTWLHPHVWASGVNDLVKKLMLNYVFDDLKFNRAQFCIDQENVRSCKAASKLGAVKEGVLRAHQIRSDGTLRDTVIYSIIRPDWLKQREGS